MSILDDTVRSSDGDPPLNVADDLTGQWIAKAGPFEYDYSWLSSSSTQTELKDSATGHFEQIYGVHPDTFGFM